MEVIDQFKAFVDDTDIAELFITGVAGTGKTTCLGEVLQHCLDNNINAVTTAYTHKACEVLRKKLPEKAIIKTLHSFLTKRPTINDMATNVSHVEGNTQMGTPETTRILFIDEFSMVGEKDYEDIHALMYDKETGAVNMKVVFIGDPNQLPPVKDAKAIAPCGPHWIKLTKVFRQASDNPLIDTLLSLNDMINKHPTTPLEAHETFERRVDIIDMYKKCEGEKVILAYTNDCVQSLNCRIEDKDEPEVDDLLFSPTTRKKYKLVELASSAPAIVTISGDIVEAGSKYKTMETLKEIPEVQFFFVSTYGDGFETVHAGVFGHRTFNEVGQRLANKAVAANKLIEEQFNTPAKEWARNNWTHPLAKNRAKCWSQFLAFKSCVHCFDFTHAMTIHKSQGSTYEYVFLDTKDIDRCRNHDYELYLKLLYVGISRASKKVYTN